MLKRYFHVIFIAFAERICYGTFMSFVWSLYQVKVNVSSYKVQVFNI